MSGNSYLRIEGLTKIYGTASAVNEVNLDVRQGEMLVLLGPSGCGKTTTLRLIAGFVEATRGRILLEGKDYAKLPPYQREMGMVFQSYALFPHLTVAQNITFGLRMRKQSKAQIASRLEETLEMVKLGTMADRYPRQLSGGQQQRVALARALAVRPKVLLLDEPLSNLDANLRQSVAREIRQLQRDAGLTALMVTHDQDEAMTMADRLVLMSDGQVQQVGTQEELYEQPVNPFVARFIGHSNLVTGELVDADTLKLPSGAVLKLARRYATRGPHTLALRPERIRLHDQADGAPPRATALIEDATYVGGHIDYLLSFQDGMSLALYEPTGTAISNRRPRGETVGITWDGINERLFDANNVTVEAIAA